MPSRTPKSPYLDTNNDLFGVISTIVALAGIFLAYLMYIKRPDQAPDGRGVRGVYLFLTDKWRWDELYDRAIVRPL